MRDTPSPTTASPACSAVVADRRPLERALVVFLLEEQGVRVAAEADTMSEVLSSVEQHAPDVVVVHERFAAEHPPTVLARIRRISPETRVVVFAATGDDVPPALVLVADEVVHDPGALTDLAMALGGGSRRHGAVVGGWPRGAPDPDPSYAEPATEVERPAARPPRNGGRAARWVDRLQGLVAATTLLSLFVCVRSDPLPIATAPAEARPHLVAAYDAYEQLEEVSQRPTSAPISADEIVEIATRLVSAREMAVAAGANVTELDDEVKAVMLALVKALPAESAEPLVRALAPLFTDDERASLQSLEWLWDGAPPPTPSASSSATGGDTPAAAPPPIQEAITAATQAPEPGPTTADEPSAAPSPTPSEEATDDPTAGATDDPSAAPSPSPNDEPSDDPTVPPTGEPTPSASEGPTSPSTGPSPTSTEPSPPTSDGPSSGPTATDGVSSTTADATVSEAVEPSPAGTSSDAGTVPGPEEDPVSTPVEESAPTEPEATASAETPGTTTTEPDAGTTPADGSTPTSSEPATTP